MSLIGAKKTLVIACGDYTMDSYLEYDQRVFIHFLPARMLQTHDLYEKERIRHLIQDMNCTQVVFVGTLDDTMRERINKSLSMQSLRAAVEFDSEDLIGGKNILSADMRDHVLLERHVITQCYQLMDYYFVRDSSGKKKISVRGIVADLSEDYMKTVFHNGISFNDSISMN